MAFFFFTAKRFGKKARCDVSCCKRALCFDTYGQVGRQTPQPLSNVWSIVSVTEANCQCQLLPTYSTFQCLSGALCVCVCV